jgi:hypothetical protein
MDTKQKEKNNRREKWERWNVRELIYDYIHIYACHNSNWSLLYKHRYIRMQFIQVYYLCHRKLESPEF